MKFPRYAALNDLKWKELAGGIAGLHLKGLFNKPQKTVNYYLYEPQLAFDYDKTELKGSLNWEPLLPANLMHTCIVFFDLIIFFM